MIALVMEWIGMLVLTAVVITQVLWPIVRGTVLFPLFRREHRLRQEIASENQRHVEAVLEAELQKLRNEHNQQGDKV